MKNIFDLSSKVAIVTGAGRGIGQALAVGLASAGASVVAADVIDTNKTVGLIEKMGRKSFGLRADVTRKEDVDAMVTHALDELGRIDILVNNAGIFRGAPAEETHEEDWDKVMDINLKGQFMCAQAVGRQMIEQKSGRIINIASIAGISAFASSVAYNSSKAGVILMTKTLAAEWGKYGILVNAICPGVIRTPMTEGFLKDKGFVLNLKARVPLQRAAMPDELAGAAIYLACDASSYTTGHALVVDGGWTCWL